MEAYLRDKIIPRFRNAGIEEDDLYQEARILLPKAIATYRPDSGASFKTYATTIIRHRWIDMIRRLESKAKDEVSLEDTNLSDPSGDPALRLQKQEEMHALFERLRDRLSPREHAVLQLRMQECSYEEIATRLGITKKSVDNTVQRIRQKMGH